MAPAVIAITWQWKRIGRASSNARKTVRYSSFFVPFFKHEMYKETHWPQVGKSLAFRIKIHSNLAPELSFANYAFVNQDQNYLHMFVTTSLVSDIPAGDGKLVNLFLRCSDRVVYRSLAIVSYLKTKNYVMFWWNTARQGISCNTRFWIKIRPKLWNLVTL
jgi:hypothetical protein